MVGAEGVGWWNQRAPELEGTLELILTTHVTDGETGARGGELGH